MVWLYVIGYIAMIGVTVYGDVYMANNHYSIKYRNDMRSDRANIAVMMGCCVFFWWLILPYQIIYMAACKVQKAYK